MNLREIQADQSLKVESEKPPATISTFGTPFDLNLIGLWTLYLKEVRRFLKVPLQTIAAPLVTTLMFLLVFSVALGRADREIEGISFLSFLAPGLIMMAIIQNAFANTSSSIMIGKIQGNIIDVLMPPLRSSELLFGIVAGGVTRGLLVAIVVAIAMMFVTEIGNISIPFAVFYAFSGSLMLSILGVLGGLWAEKFDQMSMVTNFVVTPLSFLSGTFYSITQLPESFQAIAYINPFFYLIDGLRFAFIGQSDGSILIGIMVVSLINIGLWFFALHLVRLGYRIKA